LTPVTLTLAKCFANNRGMSEEGRPVLVQLNLVAADVKTYDAFRGARYAIVEDPDGNSFGLMSPIDAARKSSKDMEATTGGLSSN